MRFLYFYIYSIRPENVAKAMVNLIQKGQNGDVWISEANQPPVAVEFTPIKKVKLPNVL